MKTKRLWAMALLLLATLGLTSCDKDKEKLQDLTGVTINGKDYPIVRIGTQLWTAENYSGDGGTYYRGNGANSTYGKLYTLDEAKAVVLPAGWRLPTIEDYKKLMEGQGVVFEQAGNYTYQSTPGTAEAVMKLAATTGWLFKNGSNASKFKALPAGEGDSNNDFFNMGHGAFFWTSSLSDEHKPFFVNLMYSTDSDNFYVQYVARSYGQKYSLRFVRDN